MDYVKDVTDENSKNFIPAEDRIAVFDMNGTIYCETDPFYLEVLLLMARFQDDRYTPSQEVQELIRALMGESDDGFALEGSQFERIYGEAFAGMTLKEYETFVKDFIE